jgi:hypothetical protein
MLVLRARGPNCVARGVGHSFAPIHRGGDKPYGGGSLLQPARVVRTTNRAFRFIASVQTVPSLFVQVRPVRVRATLCAEPSRGFFYQLGFLCAVAGGCRCSVLFVKLALCVWIGWS